MMNSFHHTLLSHFYNKEVLVGADYGWGSGITPNQYPKPGFVPETRVEFRVLEVPFKATVLQNWKSVKLKCGVLGHCVTILVHQYHASTSEIEIISIGIHDLAASQHQFLDVTKRFVASKNWC